MEQRTEYFLSGGAIILTFIVGGHKEVISFCILSAIPENVVDPPDTTVNPVQALYIVNASKFELLHLKTNNLLFF
jgi:hypothetical protein